jgi:hypothetical protein
MQAACSPRLDGIGSHIHREAIGTISLEVGGYVYRLTIHVGSGIAKTVIPIWHAHIHKVDDVTARVIDEGKDVIQVNANNTMMSSIVVIRRGFMRAILSETTGNKYRGLFPNLVFYLFPYHLGSSVN